MRNGDASFTSLQRKQWVGTGGARPSVHPVVAAAASSANIDAGRPLLPPPTSRQRDRPGTWPTKYCDNDHVSKHEGRNSIELVRNPHRYIPISAPSPSLGARSALQGLRTEVLDDEGVAGGVTTWTE